MVRLTFQCSISGLNRALKASSYSVVNFENAR
ncbi:hypothetical protein ACVWZM_004122 [Bradyrhizobium sp. USDA 4501]